VGDIITRVQENQKIQLFLTLSGLLLVGCPDDFVYLGLMIYYNWKLTLLVLGIIPRL